MKGTTSGSARLKMTRPTVVSMSVRSTSWTSACEMSWSLYCVVRSMYLPE